MKLAKKFGWYWNRLSCMSAGEIGYRTWVAIHANAQRFGFFTAKKVPPPDLSKASKSWMKNVTGIDANPYIRSADSILEGKLEIFSIESKNPDSSPQWNRDPLTGKKVPLEFGKTINYRDIDKVGDIKFLWEPNRHLQLVTLAQAYRLSGESRYLDGLALQLNSWFDQCPYLMGPNWASSLELGIRLINWSFIWHLIGGIDSPLFVSGEGNKFLDRWLTSIYQHAHFIHGHFSRFSSANNHLIGEAAGLFVATTTWPFWKDFVKWQSVAEKVLEREALLQNAPDGVNREQAVSYQQFVLDFLLITALTGRANGIEFSKDLWNRIESMLEFLSSIMDFGGHIPMIGDSDDGYVVRLSQEDKFCPYKSLLATGAVVFGRADFKFKAGGLDDKTRWLLGSTAEQEYTSIKESKANIPVRRVFPDGGYYILGSDFETDDEIRLVVDAGPLGYQSIAAHGHADALAFTLSAGGKEILIDTGTYTYYTDTEWRDYFRGTSAHNTARVDGNDQAVMGGNFVWTRKVNGRCEEIDLGNDVDHFVGAHDGYTRLRDPVIHRREIFLYKKNKKVVVIDTFECKGFHEVEQYWHFSEKCKVDVEGSLVIAADDRVSVRMRLDNDVEVNAHSGNSSTRAGWLSRRFYVKIPTTTVFSRKKIQGRATLVTEIFCHFK